MYKYLVGLFDDEEPLLAAVRAIKQDGRFRIHDAVTPFPVHGLEHALEARETKLHTAGFIFGALGTTTALLVMSLVSAVDWPNNFGGKPALALPSFIPITFELTVLFASVGMVTVFYRRNGFSIFKDAEPYHPRLTSDRFGIVFDMDRLKTDADRAALADLLTGLNAIEVIESETKERQPDFDEQAR